MYFSSYDCILIFLNNILVFFAELTLSTLIVLVAVVSQAYSSTIMRRSLCFSPVESSVSDPCGKEAQGNIPQPKNSGGNLSDSDSEIDFGHFKKVLKEVRFTYHVFFFPFLPMPSISVLDNVITFRKVIQHLVCFQLWADPVKM